jgi:L-2,4-diaminobutyrate decarboxylase
MDVEFRRDRDGLHRALALLCESAAYTKAPLEIPTSLPEVGLGSLAVLDRLAPAVLGSAVNLGGPMAFAHMDPPTPWIAWATTLWNASLNQNLLHQSTGPVAREIEERVIAWLAPFFGMNGGHMTAGSTLANLTALWAAREVMGIEEVVASEAAHISVVKAARLLRLQYRAVPADASGAMAAEQLPADLSKAAVVLTAGTTSTGALDPLHLIGRAAWTHVDAAWAGPLRLTPYAKLLAGIERADSVAVSAHKWLFQPKDSGMILFKDARQAHAAVSFGGEYLATPNVGVLGSRGASAIPLLATLMAWGRQGLAAYIDQCIVAAHQFAEALRQDQRFELLAPPVTAIVVWRPSNPSLLEQVIRRLPLEAASTTTVRAQRWLRCVAANPNVDIDQILSAINRALT